MLSNTEQCKAMPMVSNADATEYYTKTQRTTKLGKAKQKEKKILPKAVPRAAAAYGRQLKIDSEKQKVPIFDSPPKT